MVSSDDNEEKEAPTEEAPTVLDTEEEEDRGKAAGKAASQSIGQARAINATRDEEVVAEALARRGGPEDDDDEEEIESVRAQARESDEEEGEGEPEEEDELESSPGTEYFQKVIEKANGQLVSQIENLKLHLTGDIVLSVTDRKEGYHFSWKNDALQLEHWTDKVPKKSKCKIEVKQKDLELILRGRLNPQVAMLSHKVNVSGDPSHAVYFFNLFSSGRR